MNESPWQGYPGLDGAKGESGAVGAKVRPTSWEFSCHFLYFFMICIVPFTPSLIHSFLSTLFFLALSLSRSLSVSQLSTPSLHSHPFLYLHASPLIFLPHLSIHILSSTFVHLSLSLPPSLHSHHSLSFCRSFTFSLPPYLH